MQTITTTTKINDFIDQYNDAPDKSELFATHLRNRYVPLEEKQSRAAKIIQSSFYDGTRFRQNSTGKYMLARISLVETYTDLEFSSDILGDFNLLNKIRFFDYLLEHVDQRELAEFLSILEMETADAIANEYEPGGFIRGQVERFSTILGVSLGPVLEKIDVDEALRKLNEFLTENR